MQGGGSEDADEGAGRACLLPQVGTGALMSLRGGLPHRLGMLVWTAGGQATDAVQKRLCQKNGCLFSTNECVDRK